MFSAARSFPLMHTTNLHVLPENEWELCSVHRADNVACSVVLCKTHAFTKNIYSLFEQMTIREKMGEKRHHTRSTQKLGRIYEEENKREKRMREHFDFERLLHGVRAAP